MGIYEFFFLIDTDYLHTLTNKIPQLRRETKEHAVEKSQEVKQWLKRDLIKQMLERDLMRQRKGHI